MICKTCVVDLRKVHLGLIDHFFLSHLQSMQAVTTCVTLDIYINIYMRKNACRIVSCL